MGAHRLRMGILKNIIRHLLEISLVIIVIAGYACFIDGIADSNWVHYEIDGIAYNDGLWQTCNDESGCSFLSGITGTLNGTISNIDENSNNGEQELSIYPTDAFSLWMIRSTMIITVVMPVFALISVCCRNRFFAYVCNFTSGAFAMVTVA